MSDSNPAETQVDAIRIQSVLDATLDHVTGRTEAERAEALARTLSAELTALPLPRRPEVLRALVALNPNESTGSGSGGAARRVRELEAELEEMQAELERRAAAPAEPAPRDHTGGVGGRVLDVLVGGRGDGAAPPADASAEERAVGLVRELVSFAVTMLRAGAATPDRTTAGRFEGMLAGEVLGRVAEGTVAGELEQVRRQFGAQMSAFVAACERGFKEALKPLSPAVIEAEA